MFAETPVSMVATTSAPNTGSEEFAGHLLRPAGHESGV